MKRALIVEQLNPDQWHVVRQGWPVPRNSLEGMPGGVLSFNGALADALDRSVLTGIPVLVQPLNRRPRRLMPQERARRFRRIVRSQARPTLDQIMGLDPWDGAA
ncbi:hypothetical protein LQ953_13240 [Sphingomonas sp. IC-56]|uniref:hypothetical protein n=1 Tax=Sphingomonas sp. IC-56 TaxID=2898529 RepID=UPI001E5F33E2|nr:hypothetical protein [Sphingomonas sp. IC-56]MCD2324982.1 hypothetical protein [Sphingomonas sp. IC-56]